MLSRTLAFLFSTLLLVGAEKTSSLRKRNLQLTTFECILVEVTTAFEDHSSTSGHACEGRGDDGEFDAMYTIDDNNGKILTLLGDHALDVAHNSGRYKVTMTNVMVNLDPVVTTTPSTEVSFEDLGPDSEFGAVANVETTEDGITFTCTLFEIATEFEDHTSIFEHICTGDDDLIYRIDDNNDKIANKLDVHGLNVAQNSGRYKVTLTNIIMDGDSIIVTSPKTEVQIDDLGDGSASAERRLAVTGTRSMVIIRAEASDLSMSYSSSQIADAFFGTSGDQNNMADRYEVCSMGNLKFTPGSGTDFVNGVTTISIGINMNSGNIHDIVNQITQKVKEKYGSSLRSSYNHVVYVVPRGTTFGVGGSNSWLAFAYMNSYLSVYNDNNAMYISNQVHETGHNLGLMHSSDNGVTYGDQSGTMGYGYGKFDFPQMCFNAAKSWQLGWYQSKAIDLKPDEIAWTGSLDAFVDYNNVPSNEAVLLRVGTYHMIYNKKKGINSETQENGDKITVSEMVQTSEYSQHKAALSSGGKYTFPYKGSSAVFEVCSTENSGGIDKAKVSVYMSSASTGCNGPPTSLVATSPPTPQPVVQPTPQPISTPDPTPPPTSPPVLDPTNPPTSSPTPPPTNQPTDSPTPPPTPGPTYPPTPGPTYPPTPAPTNPPTESPTPPPSSPPTTAPVTAAPTYADCPNGEMDVRITINTDSNPGEIAWYLKRRKGLPIASKSSYSDANSMYSHRYCIDDSQAYEFRILDSGNNGISTMDDAYTITVNGEPYSSSDGSFGSEEVDFIVPPCTMNQEMLQFILYTGTNPGAVSWSVQQQPSGGVISSGGPWTGHEGTSLGYVWHECLNPALCYKVAAVGVSGGSLEVNWRGETVSNNSYDIEFGNC